MTKTLKFWINRQNVDRRPQEQYVVRVPDAATLTTVRNNMRTDFPSIDVADVEQE